MRTLSSGPYGKPVAVLLCLVLLHCVVATPVYAQGNSFKKIRYQGGTIETNVKPKDWGNRLTVTSDLVLFEFKDGQKLEIDPASVTGLSYGQEAHRRVGTMIVLGILLTPIALFGLFHKTRKHYIGIEFTTAEGKKSALLIQAHKKNYRAVLVALRGATGAPVAVAEDDRKYLPIGVEATVVAKSKTEENQAATIHCTSTPEGADIYVDDEFVGNTPSTLSVEPGKHTIRISLEGYKDWKKKLKIKTRSEVNLNAKLKQE